MSCSILLLLPEANNSGGDKGREEGKEMRGEEQRGHERRWEEEGKEK